MLLVGTSCLMAVATRGREQSESHRQTVRQRKREEAGMTPELEQALKATHTTHAEAQRACRLGQPEREALMVLVLDLWLGELLLHH